MAERKVLFVYRLIAVLFGSLSCGTAFFKVGDEENCNNSLGMESGDLKDEQITASTWLYFKKRDTRYYRPYFARLNYQPSGGGWCSDDIHTYPDQYIEIDLKENMKVTGIASQGRHGGSEWVDKYKIEYQRNSGSEFRQYKEDNLKIFKGNNDTDSIVRRSFLKPMILRRIRIYPQGSHFTIYCMRIELYGCSWNKAKDSLISYSAPYGEIFNGMELQDNIYDGFIQKQPGLVLGGLGKLTNGIYGQDDLESKTQAKDWVGYTGSPALIFRFEKSRIFKGIRFHVCNKNKNIRLFSEVHISVSQDGKIYNSTSVFKPTLNDTNRIGVFSVQGNLGNIRAKFLKCAFQLPRNSWLLISEVDFKSDSMMPNPTLPWKIVRTDNDDNLVEQRSFTHKHDRPTQPVPRRKSTYKVPTGNQVLIKGDQKRKKGDLKGLSFPIILTIALVSIVIVVVLIAILIRHLRKSKDINDEDKLDEVEAKRFTPVPTKSVGNAAPDLLPEERVSLCGGSGVKFQRSRTPVPLTRTT